MLIIKLSDNGDIFIANRSVGVGVGGSTFWIKYIYTIK